MATMQELFDGSGSNEIETTYDIVSRLRSVGGTFDGPASEFVTCAETANIIEHLADRLDIAMRMLAKLRDDRFYPKGGYSSDVQCEWDALLDAWKADARIV